MIEGELVEKGVCARARERERATYLLLKIFVYDARSQLKLCPLLTSSGMLAHVCAFKYALSVSSLIQTSSIELQRTVNCEHTFTTRQPPRHIINSGRIRVALKCNHLLRILINLFPRKLISSTVEFCSVR